MKRTTESEETALEAVSLLCDIIDKISADPPPPILFARDTRETKTPSATKTLRNTAKWRDAGDPWLGWSYEGLELLDTGGNRYGQDEIRAIFYNRRRLRHLENALLILRPPPKPREPEQLTLGFDPAWKVFATH